MGAHHPHIPPGRRCAANNCTSRLSIYNPTDHCHPHSPLRYPYPLKRTR